MTDSSSDSERRQRACFRPQPKYFIANNCALWTPPGMSRVFQHAHGVAQDLFEAFGLWPECRAIMSVYVLSIAHLGTGKTDKLPPDHPCVSAMHGIAEHSFDRVDS